MAIAIWAGSDCVRTSSSRPQLRRISMVRGRRPVALGKAASPGCFSMTRTRTPARASGTAVARPDGPAPTTTTS